MKYDHRKISSAHHTLHEKAQHGCSYVGHQPKSN